MHVRGGFFQGYHQTITAHMSSCVNLQRSVPSETVFSPGTVGGETRAGNGKLREKQPRNPALESGSLLLCLYQSCREGITGLGAALPPKSSLCSCRLSGVRDEEQRRLMLYKAHVFCKVTWQRGWILLAFHSLSSIPHRKQPQRNHQEYSEKNVLLGECKFSITCSSAAPFLGNYYKRSSLLCRAGLGWFSTAQCYH